MTLAFRRRLWYPCVDLNRRCEMVKFVSYEKLSKKKKRELNAKRRGSWGGLSPVTRKPANPKAYNRAKARRWDRDPSAVLLC